MTLHFVEAEIVDYYVYDGSCIRISSKENFDIYVVDTSLRSIYLQRLWKNQRSSKRVISKLPMLKGSVAFTVFWIPAFFSIVMVNERKSAGSKCNITIRMVKKRRISVVCYDTGKSRFSCILIQVIRKSDFQNQTIRLENWTRGRGKDTHFFLQVAAAQSCDSSL